MDNPEQPKPAVQSPEAEPSNLEQEASLSIAAAAVELRVGDTIAAAAVATSGKRQAFSNIRRQLSETDLASPGVQKMLLEELDRAESQCEVAEGFRERFHTADKEAAILREKLKTANTVEVFFGLGVAIGSAMIGLAPYFWDKRAEGMILLTVGAIMCIGSSIARMIKS
jgi:hypothetical protein